MKLIALLAIATTVLCDEVCKEGPTIYTDMDGTVQAADKSGLGDRNCSWLIQPPVIPGMSTRIQLSWEALELINSESIIPFPPGYEPGAGGAFVGDCPLAFVEVYKVAEDSGSDELLMRVCGEMSSLDERIKDIGVVAPAVKVQLHSSSQAQFAVDFALEWTVQSFEPEPSPSTAPSPPPAVAKDCLLGAWYDWQACTAACGYGTQVRTRPVLRRPGPGGAQCGPLYEEQYCYARSCSSLDQDRDCQLDEWHAWGNCTKSCGTGTRVQTRDVVEGSVGTGTCDSIVRSSECNAVPCDEPTACDEAVVIQGQESGVISIGHKSSEATDDEQSGPPVPPSSACEWRIVGSSMQDVQLVWDWVEMPVLFNGSCNLLTTGEVEVLQGTGGYAGEEEIDSRCAVESLPGGPGLDGRTVQTHNSTEMLLRLFTPSSEGAWGFRATFQLLNRAQPTPSPELPVNCTLGNWTEWSGCSAACGPGEQTRSREVVSPARHGGLCPGPLEETLPCDAGPCSDNATDTDCQVSAWGNYSACSAECGGGVQVRTRTVLVPSSGSGMPCPGLNESRVCNTEACSDDAGGQDDDPWSPSDYPSACDFDETGVAQTVSVGQGSFSFVVIGGYSVDGHPAVHDTYPADATCVWTVTARPFERAWCSLLDVDIDVSQDCAADGVSGCDGPADSCDPLGSAVCGSSADALLQGWNATGSSLTIRFSSDSDLPRGKGFLLQCGAQVREVDQPQVLGQSASVRLGVVAAWLAAWQSDNPGGSLEAAAASLASSMQGDLRSVLGVAQYRVTVPASGVQFGSYRRLQAGLGADLDDSEASVVVELQGYEINSAETLETSAVLLQRLLDAMAACPGDIPAGQQCPEGTGLFGSGTSASKYLAPGVVEYVYSDPAQISLSTQSVAVEAEASYRGQSGHAADRTVTVSNGGGQTLVVSSIEALLPSSSMPHFLSVTPASLEVPAGEGREITLRFDPEQVPTGNNGPLYGFVELRHSVVDGPHTIAAELSFTGVPEPSVGPAPSPSSAPAPDASSSPQPAGTPTPSPSPAAAGGPLGFDVESIGIGAGLVVALGALAAVAYCLCCGQCSCCGKKKTTGGGMGSGSGSKASGGGGGSGSSKGGAGSGSGRNSGDEGALARGASFGSDLGTLDAPTTGDSTKAGRSGGRGGGIELGDIGVSQGGRGTATGGGGGGGFSVSVPPLSSEAESAFKASLGAGTSTGMGGRGGGSGALGGLSLGSGSSPLARGSGSGAFGSAAAAPAVVPMRLIPSASLAAQEFEANWASLSTLALWGGQMKPGAAASADALERALQPAGILCMASGEISGVNKHFFFGKDQNGSTEAERLYMAEASVTLASGRLSVVIKGGGPSSRQFVDEFKRRVRPLLSSE